MRHVNLGPEDLLAVSVLAGLHLAEETEVLLRRAVAPGAVLTRLVNRATAFADLLLRLVVDIRLAPKDHLLGPLVELVEIIGGIEFLLPLEAQPVDVLLDGVHIFGVFLGRIGIVITEVGLSAIFLCQAEIKADALRVTEVQIAVRLRRETGHDAVHFAGCEVLLDDFFQKIAGFCLFHLRIRINYPTNLVILRKFFNTGADMIQSMTGYGKAEALLSTGKLTLEIRTLNGKNADITIKTPLLPKDKELEVRSRLAQALTRGTIDLYATWEPAAGESVRSINEPLLLEYFQQVKQISEKAGIGIHPSADPATSAVLMNALLRLPDVVEAKKNDVITETQWPLVSAAIDKAVAAVNAFRDREGSVLYDDVTSRIRTILGFYDEIERLEGERIATVRARLQKNLEDLSAKVDPSRFEQEMIFYLEKLDINEEKVRLRQHCRYFMETIDGEPAPGKKLGFILQEMGREINTTGSKANHAGIQKLVVRAKDELEKIREQSMNIL